VLEELSRAQLLLSAHRCGVIATTRRAFAAAITQPQTALQVCQRGEDARAGQLVRLLVEYGGNWVPRCGELEVEAERLAGWFPFVETERGWRAGSDFATAATPFGKRERFFAATLIGRLSPGGVRLMAENLGTDLRDAPRQACHHLHDAILHSMTSEGLDDLFGAIARNDSIAAKTIQEVVHLEGPRFAIVLDKGERMEVCPRELAERQGVRFQQTPVVAATLVTSSALRVPPPRIPEFIEIAAIVTFSSTRAANEAQEHEALRHLWARRVDRRRLATRPSSDATDTQALLFDAGFSVELKERA